MASAGASTAKPGSQIATDHRHESEYSLTTVTLLMRGTRKSHTIDNMKRQLFAILPLLFVSSVAVAQTQQQRPPAPTQQQAAADAALQRLCAQQACQRNVSVQLRDKQGNHYSKTFALLPPVVQGPYFTVTSGQSLFIEADVVGDKVTNYKVVPGMQNPAKTFIVSLSQLDDARSQLFIVNPFAQNVKFNVGVLPLGSRKVVKTNSCPVQPRKQGSIIWDKPVLQATIGYGVALAPNAKFVCGE